MSTAVNQSRRNIASPAQVRDVQPAPAWQVLAMAAGLVLAGVIVYWNSFGGQFVLDDESSICHNPDIRRLWPLDKSIFAPGDVTRPTVALTFALNFAAGGLNLWGYHLVNVAIHILAALTLFGIVRRTLQTHRLRDRFGRHSLWLAGAISLIWLVHPLQTNTATYLVQRAESLMGLLYLLTLYCVIRGHGAARRQWLWYVPAIVACILGMGAKQVMVTVPLVVLAYDWLFLAGGMKDLLRRRWWLYAGLAAGWAALAAMMSQAPRTMAQGVDLATFKWWEYALCQFDVILQYLRRSVWPADLCLDPYWPTVLGAARTKVLPGLIDRSVEPYGVAWDRLLPGMLAVLSLVTATAVSLWRRRPRAFLGVWFFLILAPTSTVLPIADLMFEHRMYLPLASVATAAVLLAYLAGRRLLTALPANRPAAHKTIALSLAVLSILAAAGTLGCLTVERNKDYSSPVVMWRDIIRKNPRNARAYASLAIALDKEGRTDEAIVNYEKGIAIEPLRHQEMYYNLGFAYSRKGDYRAAIHNYETAIRGPGPSPGAFNNLAMLLATCSQDDIRNGPLAVRLATRACELTNWADPLMIDTLAAAYAEVRDFDKACQNARNAIQMAQSRGDDKAIKEFQLRLELYRTGEPYREKPVPREGSTLPGTTPL